MRRTLTNLASFWFGAELGMLERLCAVSLIEQGSSLTLYSYSPVRNVPSGVNVADARKVLPAEKIFYYRKSGSPALHSDLFRIALISSTDMMWVDLDFVALKQLNFQNPYVFGWESSFKINSAVLRLPRESLALNQLQSLCLIRHGVPPFLTGGKKFKYWVKNLLQKKGLSIEDWPWGSFGPSALTNFLANSGEIAYAFPRECFYPLSATQIGKVLQPGALSLNSFNPETYGIHLWGKKLRLLLQAEGESGVLEGSLLAELLSLYRIRI